MARVNVETTALTDPRFKMMAVKLGVTHFEVLGRMIFIWSYCTERNTDKLTEEIIDLTAELHGFAETLRQCDLAVKIGNQFRIRGAKGRIEWLTRVRNNGKKGGRPKKPDGNQLVSELETKSKPSGFENQNPLALALSPALVLSPALAKKNKDRSAKGAADGTPHSQDLENNLNIVVHEFIGVYVKAFKGRFGNNVRPDLSGKVQGQIKRFLAETKPERAKALIETYLSMKDHWFETKAYDFTTFLENLQKIGLAVDRGDVSGRPFRKPLDQVISE
jgi:hypothetical protein